MDYKTNMDEGLCDSCIRRQHSPSRNKGNYEPYKLHVQNSNAETTKSLPSMQHSACDYLHGKSSLKCLPWRRKKVDTDGNFKPLTLRTLNSINYLREHILLDRCFMWTVFIRLLYFMIETRTLLTKCKSMQKRTFCQCLLLVATLLVLSPMVHGQSVGVVVSSTPRIGSGLLDAATTVGMAFIYKIPRSVFNCELERLEISEGSSRSLSNWLAYDNVKQELYGVPSHKDTGAYDILVVALGKGHPDTGSICGMKAFTITVIADDSSPQNSVYPESRSIAHDSDKLNFKPRRTCEHLLCVPGMQAILASILIHVDLYKLTGHQRMVILTRMAQHLKISSDQIALFTADSAHPLITQLDNPSMMVSGAGDGRYTKGQRSVLTWRLSCGAMRLGNTFLSQLETKAQDGTISTLLGHPVVGWHVTSGVQKARHRVRRAVAGATPTPTATSIPPTHIKNISTTFLTDSLTLTRPFISQNSTLMPTSTLFTIPVTSNVTLKASPTPSIVPSRNFTTTLSITTLVLPASKTLDSTAILFYSNKTASVEPVMSTLELNATTAIAAIPANSTMISTHFIQNATVAIQSPSTAVFNTTSVQPSPAFNSTVVSIAGTLTSIPLQNSTFIPVSPTTMVMLPENSTVTLVAGNSTSVLFVNPGNSTDFQLPGPNITTSPVLNATSFPTAIISVVASSVINSSRVLSAYPVTITIQPNVTAMLSSLSVTSVVSSSTVISIASTLTSIPLQNSTFIPVSPTTMIMLPENSTVTSVAGNSTSVAGNSTSVLFVNSTSILVTPSTTILPPGNSTDFQLPGPNITTSPVLNATSFPTAIISVVASSVINSSTVLSVYPVTRTIQPNVTAMLSSLSVTSVVSSSAVISIASTLISIPLQNSTFIHVSPTTMVMLPENSTVTSVAGNSTSVAGNSTSVLFVNSTSILVTPSTTILPPGNSTDFQLPGPNITTSPVLNATSFPTTVISVVTSSVINSSTVLSAYPVTRTIQPNVTTMLSSLPVTSVVPSSAGVFNQTGSIVPSFETMSLLLPSPTVTSKELDATEYLTSNITVVPSTGISIKASANMTSLLGGLPNSTVVISPTVNSTAGVTMTSVGNASTTLLSALPSIVTMPVMTTVNMTATSMLSITSTSLIEGLPTSIMSRSNAFSLSSVITIIPIATSHVTLTRTPSNIGTRENSTLAFSSLMRTLFSLIATTVHLLTSSSVHIATHFTPVPTTSIIGNGSVTSLVERDLTVNMTGIVARTSLLPSTVGLTTNTALSSNSTLLSPSSSRATSRIETINSSFVTGGTIIFSKSSLKSTSTVLSVLPTSIALLLNSSTFQVSPASTRSFTKTTGTQTALFPSTRTSIFYSVFQTSSPIVVQSTIEAPNSTGEVVAATPSPSPPNSTSGIEVSGTASTTVVVIVSSTPVRNTSSSPSLTVLSPSSTAFIRRTTLALNSTIIVKASRTTSIATRVMKTTVASPNSTGEVAATPSPIPTVVVSSVVHDLKSTRFVAATSLSLSSAVVVSHATLAPNSTSEVVVTTPSPSPTVVVSSVVHDLKSTRFVAATSLSPSSAVVVSHATLAPNSTSEVVATTPSPSPTVVVSSVVHDLKSTRFVAATSLSLSSAVVVSHATLAPNSTSEVVATTPSPSPTVVVSSVVHDLKSTGFVAATSLSASSAVVVSHATPAPISTSEVAATRIPPAINSSTVQGLNSTSFVPSTSMSSRSTIVVSHSTLAANSTREVAATRISPSLTVVANSTMPTAFTTLPITSVSPSSPALPSSVVSSTITATSITLIPTSTLTVITTTTPPITAPPITKPDVINDIGRVPATAGRALKYQVPPDTFHDKKDGGTRNLTLALFLINQEAEQEIPDNFWLQFDARNQIMYGLPMNEDIPGTPEKGVEFILKATNNHSGFAYDAFEIYISKASIPHVQELSMRLSNEFVVFSTNVTRRLQLITKIANYYGDSNQDNIRVLSILQGSVLFSWTNDSLPTSECDVEKNNYVFNRIVQENGEVRLSFTKALDPFTIQSASRKLTGVCNTTNIPPTGIPAKRESTTATDLWLKHVLPGIFVGIILIIIAILLIYYLRRKRVKPSDPEKRTYKKRKPIILEPEMEMKQLPSKPLILPDDDPSQPPSYMSETSLNKSPYSYYDDENDGDDEEDFKFMDSPPSPIYETPPPLYGDFEDVRNIPPPSYRLPPMFYNQYTLPSWETSSDV